MNHLQIIRRQCAELVSRRVVTEEYYQKEMGVMSAKFWIVVGLWPEKVNLGVDLPVEDKELLRIGKESFPRIFTTETRALDRLNAINILFVIDQLYRKDDLSLVELYTASFLWQFFLCRDHSESRRIAMMMDGWDDRRKELIPDDSKTLMLLWSGKYTEALAVSARHLPVGAPPYSVETGTILYGRIMALFELGRYDEAIKLSQDCLTSGCIVHKQEKEDVEKQLVVLLRGQRKKLDSSVTSQTAVVPVVPSELHPLVK